MRSGDLPAPARGQRGREQLPSKATEALAELFGPIPELLYDMVRDLPPDFDLALEQARKAGYANCFEAVASDVVWRPVLPGSDGRAHPKPTAHGAQTAIVVGPDGSDTPAGADELYCDALGRVRIRYHWQDSGDATCWVRVAQRLAGGGIGSQFLPRIGQEVVVQFIENDIDRPLIRGRLIQWAGRRRHCAHAGRRSERLAVLSASALLAVVARGMT